MKQNSFPIKNYLVKNINVYTSIEVLRKFAYVGRSWKQPYYESLWIVSN